MRLLIACKLDKDKQTAKAVVKGLLHDGERVEPIFILRASDPAVILTANQYLVSGRNADYPETVLNEMRAFSQRAARWQQECGALKPTEPALTEDWTEEAPREHVATGEPKGAKPLQAGKPKKAGR